MFVTETVDIEGMSADEVSQPLDRLGGTDETATAAAHCFAWLTHGVAAAFGTELGKDIRTAVRRSPVRDYGHDLGNDVSGTLNDDSVALSYVFALDLVLIV